MEGHLNANDRDKYSSRKRQQKSKLRCCLAAKEHWGKWPEVIFMNPQLPREGGRHVWWVQQITLFFTQHSPTTPTTHAPTTKPLTTVAPTDPQTTAMPTTKPTAAPGSFDMPSFIGGIILCAGVVAIAFFGCKFYKNRSERNYHTL